MHVWGNEEKSKENESKPRDMADELQDGGGKERKKADRGGKI